mgnify:CR=1 FL=1
MKMESMYEQLGVSAAVYEYGENVLRDLRPRFDAIDQTAEINQGKVLHAMQKNKVNAECLSGTTGYGYDDFGRDTLEKVYADCFRGEAALVRPQITCGTHALALALRLAQGKVPAHTKPLAASEQHSAAALDALNEAFLAE